MHGADDKDMVAARGNGALAAAEAALDGLSGATRVSTLDGITLSPRHAGDVLGFGASALRRVVGHAAWQMPDAGLDLVW